MRWPQESFAVLLEGKSSEQVRHSTRLVEVSEDGLLRKIESMKDSRLFFGGLADWMVSGDGLRTSSSITAGSAWAFGGDRSRTTVRGRG